MMPQMNKRAAYADLVQARKACAVCGAALTNPAQYCGGAHDCDEIGTWSRWRGDLDAAVMVVGQDWGDVGYFERNRGLDDPVNPTNVALVALMREAGIDLGAATGVFLTNAILCLKGGNMQATVTREWFEACGPRFLRPLIELVQPRVLVTLGAHAYASVARLYGLERRRFRAAVETPAGIELPPAGPRLFPMYHCGRRILNTHRGMDAQRTDWRRVGVHLASQRTRPAARSADPTRRSSW